MLPRQSCCTKIAGLKIALIGSLTYISEIRDTPTIFHNRSVSLRQCVQVWQTLQDCIRRIMLFAPLSHSQLTAMSQSSHT